METYFIYIGVIVVIKLIVIFIFFCIRAQRNRKIREQQIFQENQNIQRSGEYAIHHIEVQQPNNFGIYNIEPTSNTNEELFEENKIKFAENPPSYTTSVSYTHLTLPTTPYV